jgi:radical SAM/Cys-rich protein
MKSLKATHHELSNSGRQLQILAQSVDGLPRFEERLSQMGLQPLSPTEIAILQVNVGKMCNQTCEHCHVDAGPDRQEIMTRETMKTCLKAIEDSNIHTVDITGGAPEMNPDFRWFVEEVSKLGRQIMVRSNLSILTVNTTFRTLPEFFAQHRATIVSSLPCYTAENTNKQRGEGVFERSMDALQMLNAVGYGQPESSLQLHLVYNPLGAFLSPPQEQLKSNYQRVLKEKFGIVFNDLYCITNMPISRFLDYLRSQGKYEEYMETLIHAFNPAAVSGLMCRNSLSVGWEGSLYDCDFNQMLDLKVESGAPRHIRDFDFEKLSRRRIVLNQHCYGCAAGAGSSCGGEIVG